MTKLYFRYGVVSSAKTLNLLAVAHQYELQGKKVVVMKPAIDTRFGISVVKSRVGLQRNVDILVEKVQDITNFNYENVSCVLVDECQFLTSSMVDALRNLTLKETFSVICYGLRTDFQTKSFEGSRRLFEIADIIEEIKTTCGGSKCNKKAIINLRHESNGKKVIDGPQVQLGTEDIYTPVCFKHFTFW